MRSDTLTTNKANDTAAASRTDTIATAPKTGSQKWPTTRRAVAGGTMIAADAGTAIHSRDCHRRPEGAAIRIDEAAPHTAPPLNEI